MPSWCVTRGKKFANTKALGFVDEKTTMWEFQWGSGTLAARSSATRRQPLLPLRCRHRTALRAASCARIVAAGLRVRGVREAHAHQVLCGRPRCVVYRGRDGVERDGQGGGGLCQPHPWHQCEPWWNNRVRWIPNREDAPPYPNSGTLSYDTSCVSYALRAYYICGSQYVLRATRIVLRVPHVARRRTFF